MLLCEDMILRNDVQLVILLSQEGVQEICQESSPELGQDCLPPSLSGLSHRLAGVAAEGCSLTHDLRERLLLPWLTGQPDLSSLEIRAQWAQPGSESSLVMYSSSFSSHSAFEQLLATWFGRRLCYF